jgi:curved DNA-binding protein CbpA
MFVDYYALLEVEVSANQVEIKQSFRKQAFKWHPDVHPDKDTTERMKAINEAYLILKDPIARARYDNTYREFQANFNTQTVSSTQRSTDDEQSYYYHHYDIKDVLLKTWMERAREQASILVKQTIEDFRGMTVAGAKGVIKGAGEQFIGQLVVSLFFLLCFVLAKACN